MRAGLPALLEGLLELPKPCGARPRSVELPCASQVCVPLVIRWLEGLFGLPFCMRMLLLPADDGRSRERSFWRPKAPPLFGERFEPVFGEKFPARPGVSLVVFMVRTRMSDAPRAGAVRAITERFWTELGGLEALPCKLAAPNALCREGDNPTLLVTLAPLKEASVT